jgi:exonuclease SbcD
MIRIAHLADTHLGPFGAKLAPDGRNARLCDMHDAFAAAVLEASASCDIILHAGDWFHSWRPTPTTVAAGRNAVMPAAARQVPMLGIVGNHDQTRAAAEHAATELIEHRHRPAIVATRPSLWNVWRVPRGGGDPPAMESTPHAEHIIEPLDRSPADGGDLVLQVACMPWPNRQRLLTAEHTVGRSASEVNTLMRTLVLDSIRGLASGLSEGIPRVLLAHLGIDEARIGKRTMLLTGEWTLSLANLHTLPFDYIALGHIHEQQTWIVEGAPMVAYAGSTEVVDFGEEGQQKGWLQVEIEEDGSGTLTRKRTPHRRYLTLEPGDHWDPIEVANAVIRVNLDSTNAHLQREIDAELREAGAFDIRWNRKPAESAPRRQVDLTEVETLEGGIDAWLAHHPEWQERRDDLVAEAHRIEEGRSA